MARTLDLQDILTPDILAAQLSGKYDEWETYRQKWISQKQELRDYLFAVDTTSTSVANSTSWKNSTHLPKIAQLRDNLHANYMAAIFPNDRPIAWEGDDVDDDTKQKREVIEAYMANKMRASKFRIEMSKCIYDWIDWGNCFAMTEFVSESTIDISTGTKIPGYVGPKMTRISPLDIVFDPTVPDFKNTPKMIKAIKTLGGLRADIQDHPEMGYLEEVFEDVVATRHRFQSLSQGDFRKNQNFQIDGFSGFLQYFQSDYVELIDFYGDYYDVTEDKLYKNYIITVADRSRIIRKIPNPNWFGTPNIFHCGWRLRPDNLYAMGPLDNLVGMQYRIDHLENAKADAFDLIVHPVMVLYGLVEDFDYGPGERIQASEEGKVEFIRPDVTMLNADTQIAQYEQKMEEMAGAPKQAMGFRTPGEKTAYEVQILENGSNRIFLNKTSYLEEVFMEDILNSMLEVSRRGIGLSDVIRVTDDNLGLVQFLKITREDITAAGKIRPIGARHFARNANIIQNLTNFANSAIGQDPAVNAHISGKKMAFLFEELFGLERFGLVQENVRVAEAMETEQAKQSATQIIAEQHGAPMPQQGQPPNENGMVQPPQGPQGTGSVQRISPFG